MGRFVVWNYFESFIERGQSSLAGSLELTFIYRRRIKQSQTARRAQIEIM